MTDRRPHYKAFLLRLWQADNGGQPVWRLSLEEAGSHQQHLFHSVEALDTYLNELMKERITENGRARKPGRGAPFADPNLLEDDS